RGGRGGPPREGCAPVFFCPYRAQPSPPPHIAGEKTLRAAASKGWTNDPGAGRDGTRPILAFSAAMTIRYGLAILLLLCVATAPAVVEAATIDCRAPRMSPTEITICTDPQLVRADEQL